LIKLVVFIAFYDRRFTFYVALRRGAPRVVVFTRRACELSCRHNEIRSRSKN